MALVVLTLHAKERCRQRRIPQYEVIDACKNMPPIISPGVYVRWTFPKFAAIVTNSSGKQLVVTVHGGASRKRRDRGHGQRRGAPEVHRRNGNKQK